MRGTIALSLASLDLRVVLTLGVEYTPGGYSPGIE